MGNLTEKVALEDKQYQQRTKTLYIIRHGQTDYNRRGIVQGSGVDTDLNETGKKQAKSFFNHYRHIPFEKIYTSNLKRTHQTIAPFIQMGAKMEELSELNEINWGEMEGMEPTPEAHEKFIHTIQQWAQGNLDIAVHGGETPKELFERQKAGLNKIMANGENPVLICMHGRALRSFLCLLTGTPLQQMDDFEHGNVCLYVLEKLPESTYFDILVRNSRLHLHSNLH